MNFSSFDLNLLRVLDALLTTGSTTEAGQRIGLSQPAVSAALSRLRHALDDPLFVRQGRQLVATDFARSLHDPLRRILDETEALLSGGARFDPATASARFKISGSDFFAELLIPDLAERVSRMAPGITVQLVDLVPDGFIDRLQQHEIDLALLPETDFPDWIDHRRLFHSSFSTIARAGHPRLRHAGLSPGDTIPIDLFCDLQHVIFSQQGNFRAMGDAALAKVGRERRVGVTMPVFAGVCNAVSRSDMVALVPHQMALSMAPRLGLELYQAPMSLPVVAIAMVWHRRTSRNPIHIWLRDQIAALMEPLDRVAPKATIGEG
ncbi:LysR family transcriptional regulator [Thalassococcus sp. BH17M4-6]|uniref:LysR family transcriptional regulator n=1 Tax=Thalassococcus sp. BH17M4-6 TaxID=3413148 RepID=UPI003BC2388A